MLRAQLTHMTVSRIMNTTAVWVAKRRATQFKETNSSGHRLLFTFAEPSPPISKFIGVFNFPDHSLSIPYVEYAIKRIFASGL